MWQLVTYDDGDSYIVGETTLLPYTEQVSQADTKGTSVTGWLTNDSFSALLREYEKRGSMTSARGKQASGSGSLPLMFEGRHGAAHVVLTYSLLSYDATIAR